MKIRTVRNGTVHWNICQDRYIFHWIVVIGVVQLIFGIDTLQIVGMDMWSLKNMLIKGRSKISEELFL